MMEWSSLLLSLSFMLCLSVLGCKNSLSSDNDYVVICTGWWCNSAEVFVGRYSCVCRCHHYVLHWRWLFHVQLIKTAAFVGTPCTNYWSLEVIYTRLLLPLFPYLEEVEWMKDCICFSSAVCYMLYFSCPSIFRVLFMSLGQNYEQAWRNVRCDGLATQTWTECKYLPNSLKHNLGFINIVAWRCI